MTETWNPLNPILTNQIANDVPDVEENFDYLMACHGYWVDSSEADQGAAGSGNSIRDLVDAIGSTKNAVLFLKHHAADGNTTTYTLTTSETITSNITLVCQSGVRIDGAGTLTINGPFHAGMLQVFGSSITVVFGANSIPNVHPEWWGIDGTADEVEINKAITAAVNVLSVKLLNGTYDIDATITGFSDYMSLSSDAGMALITTDDDIDGITVTGANYVNVSNIYITTTHGTPTGAGLYLYDGVQVGRFKDILITAFAYGLELYSSAAATPIGYNSFEHIRIWNVVTIGFYLRLAGTGWVNENSFSLSTHCSPAATGINASLVGNNNHFIGCSFEGGDPWDFAIKDSGINTIQNCRIEVSGYGIYADNSQGGYSSAGIYTNNWFTTTKVPFLVVNAGYVRSDIPSYNTFCGGVLGSDRVSTTVDANTAADQKVLNVTATADFYVHDAVVINEDGDREEYGQIASIQDGVSLTMVADLRYAHTAAQADTVIAKGSLSGMDWNLNATNMNFYMGGIKVVSITNAGVTTVLGALTDSTAPAQ